IGWWTSTLKAAGSTSSNPLEPIRYSVTLCRTWFMHASGWWTSNSQRCYSSVEWVSSNPSRLPLSASGLRTPSIVWEFGYGSNPLSLLFHDPLQYVDIQSYAVLNFVYKDKFIGHMRTCGVSGSKLKRRNIQQGLVTGRRGAIRRAAERNPSLHHRVILGDRRRF